MNVMCGDGDDEVLVGYEWWQVTIHDKNHDNRGCCCSPISTSASDNDAVGTSKPAVWWRLLPALHML